MPKVSRMPSASPGNVIHITGGRPLCGRTRIGGSKNASLPIMAASLLTREPVKLHNLARVADTDMMRDILRELGVTLVATGPDAAVITATDVGDTVPDAMGRRMRASSVLMGALIARAGAARVPQPRGGGIGSTA